MRLEKCYFCSSTTYPGHGSLFVRNDGKQFRFCRSKCAKNFKMKRNPRKLRWTKSFRKAAGKEMCVDTTYEFEKRRNIPVRYDRDLMRSTVRAMEKVAEIRKRREKLFIQQRLKRGQEKEMKSEIKELQKHIELVKNAEDEKIQETLKKHVEMKISVPLQNRMDLE